MNPKNMASCMAILLGFEEESQKYKLYEYLEGLWRHINRNGKRCSPFEIPLTTLEFVLGGLLMLMISETRASRFLSLIFETLHGFDLHYIEDTEEKDKSSRYAIGRNTMAEEESLVGFKDGGDIDRFLHPPLL